MTFTLSQFQINGIECSLFLLVLNVRLDFLTFSHTLDTFYFFLSQTKNMKRFSGIQDVVVSVSKHIIKLDQQGNSTIGNFILSWVKEIVTIIPSYFVPSVSCSVMTHNLDIVCFQGCKSTFSTQYLANVEPIPHIYFMFECYLIQSLTML